MSCEQKQQSSLKVYNVMQPDGLLAFIVVYHIPKASPTFLLLQINDLLLLSKVINDHHAVQSSDSIKLFSPSIYSSRGSSRTLFDIPKLLV